MPLKRPSSHPFAAVHLGHAAQQNMVITMRCGACSREAHYWAVDLVKVLGMRHQVQIAPWPCRQCGTTEFVKVSWQVATAAFLDGLTVRRPVRKIERWIWRNERA